MGEIAEGLLDGTFDEWTGEYIGRAVGYPRSLDPEHYSNKRCSIKHPGYGKNPLVGIEKWLKLNGVSRTGRVIWRFSTEVLNIPYEVANTKDKERIAVIIQNGQWEQFTEWVKTVYINHK